MIEFTVNKEITKRDIVWSNKSEKILETLKYHPESKPNGLHHQLKISDCTLDDAGDYKIKIKDNKVTVKLVVKELPVKFERQLEDKSLLENSTATFECTLSKPNKIVKWYLNGVELQDNDNIQKSEARCKHTLIISKIPKDHAGILTCKVFDKEGDVEIASSTCNVTVKEIPTDFVKQLANIKCNEKESAIFECTLNKILPTDQVKWFKNGVEVTGSDNIEIKSDGVKQYLVIKKSAVDDSGSYSIKINDLTSSATCKVKGKNVFLINKILLK